MNCIIVDDEELSRLAVQKCAERTGFLNVVAMCEGAAEAQKAMIEHQVDLIFLDKEMPETTGLDLIKQFPDIPQVIFISSKPDYAAEAFDFNVTDYIVKPVDYNRFVRAAEKANQISDNIQSKDKKHLFIKKDSRFIRVDYKEILWVEALADYVNIYTDKERYTVLSTMKAIEAKLPSDEFMRIHRSFIVRFDQIKEVEDNNVSIHGKVLPISRSKKEEFVRRMNLL